VVAKAKVVSSALPEDFDNALSLSLTLDVLALPA
jgi:hypothetical protein